jgi:hypothetical protein
MTSESKNERTPSVAYVQYLGLLFGHQFHKYSLKNCVKIYVQCNNSNDDGKEIFVDNCAVSLESVVRVQE